MTCLFIVSSLEQIQWPTNGLEQTARHIVILEQGLKVSARAAAKNNAAVTTAN